MSLPKAGLIATGPSNDGGVILVPLDLHSCKRVACSFHVQPTQQTNRPVMHCRTQSWLGNTCTPKYAAAGPHSGRAAFSAQSVSVPRRDTISYILCLLWRMLTQLQLAAENSSCAKATYAWLQKILSCLETRSMQPALVCRCYHGQPSTRPWTRVAAHVITYQGHHLLHAILVEQALPTGLPLQCMEGTASFWYSGYQRSTGQLS